jgi:hypothetical protein
MSSSFGDATEVDLPVIVASLAGHRHYADPVIPAVSRQGSWRGQIEALRIASHSHKSGRGEAFAKWAVEQGRFAGCVSIQATVSPEHRLLTPRVYREKVEQLTAAFKDEALKAQAFERLRALIAALVLTPEDRDLAIDLHGELAAMLSLCAGAETQKASAAVTEEVLQVKMVAGTGFDRCRTRFRLIGNGIVGSRT